MTTLLSPKSVAILFRQLASAYRNGIPPQEVFDALGAAPDLFGKEASVLAVVAKAVAATASLSEALALCPEIFASETARLVAGAEENGTLPSMLDSIASDCMLAAESRKSVRDAMTWPVTLTVAMLIVLIMVMIFVIPAFKEVYKSFGADLPGATLVLVGLSDLFVEYWWLALLIVGVFEQLYVRNLLPARLQRLPENLAMAWPSLQRMTNSLLAVRLGLWIKACGSDRAALSAAIRHVGATSRLGRYRDAARQIADAVDGGIPPAEAFGRNATMPDYFEGLMRLASRMPAPDEALAQLDALANEAYLAALDRFARHAMLFGYLLIGVVLGWTIIGLYLPIFKLGSVV